MSQPKQNKRKMKTGFQTRTNFIIIGVSILVSVLLIVGILYLFGIRYVKYRFDTGFSVSFVGVLNGDGMPATGHISYSGDSAVKGLTATYDAENKTLEYSNGDVYEGEVKHLVKHGTGKLTRDNGDIYEGEFYEDRQHGHGVSTFANGDIYDGEYENGNKSGQGTYTWADEIGRAHV